MRISDWSSDVCSSDLAMAKEAIRGLTRVAAREWGADGITVNNILPIARTDSYDATTQDDEGQASWVPDTPIARLGSRDEDNAPVALFLASKDSQRSEERRVGKECGSRCRSRWSANY